MQRNFKHICKQLEEEYKAVDIGINPTMIKDLELKVKNAKTLNILPVFIGYDLPSSKKVVKLATEMDTFCYVGLHPNHLNLWDETITKIASEEIKLTETSDKSLQLKYKKFLLQTKEIKKELEKLLENENVVGVGECGLDFYRSNNCDEQKYYFKQLLSLNTNKPYFLHMRNAFNDFIQMVAPYKEKLRNSVVHSFDGTVEEAKQLVDFGFKLGINGCSIKHSINVIKWLNLEDMLIETDSPFCLIRKSYEASKYCNVIKAKENEPKYLLNVAEAIANIKNVQIQTVLEQTKENFIKCFKLKQKENE